MIIIEKSGKTIDEAVEAALIELGASKDEVEIEVINVFLILRILRNKLCLMVYLKSLDRIEILLIN